MRGSLLTVTMRAPATLAVNHGIAQRFEIRAPNFFREVLFITFILGFSDVK